MADSPKAYQFIFTLYPESQQNAIDYVKEHWSCAWALHDKDTYDAEDLKEYAKDHGGDCPPWNVGDLKKPHVHFVVRFKNQRYASGVAKELRNKALCSVSNAAIRRCFNLYKSYVYLWHENEEDKYKYDPDMNSRSFKDNFNAYFLNTLLTCRHSYISIYGSAQRFQHVDKLMRDVTHTVIQCKKVWRFQLWSSYDAWEMENATNAEMIKPLRRGLWFVHDEDYHAYDTLAIVDNLKKKFEDGDILTEAEIINNQAPAGPLGLEVTTNPTAKAKRRMQTTVKK